MDLVRSCYTTFMRFFEDDPLEIKVRWFFSDEEAGIWPGHHRFGSGNWASERFDWSGPGEVLEAPRVWDDGRPIDGLIGDHFCGPRLSYTEGTKFPGVPLNALEDGRCVCCVPLPPVCGDLVDALPNTLRMRILDIALIPPDGDPSNYVIGDEFDLLLTPGPTRAWFVSPIIQRDACPFASPFALGCVPFPEGVQLGLQNLDLAVSNPPALIEEFPFRAWYTFVNITTTACLAAGVGGEFWDVVIFDPAFPP